MNLKHYIIFVSSLFCTTAFADNYIVVLKKSAVQSQQSSLKVSKAGAIKTMMGEIANRYKLQTPSRIFSVVLDGGVYNLTEQQADKLSQDTRVDFIEKDKPVYASSVQNRPTWGLDRIDQYSLPLSNSYSYPSNGAYQVNVYVVDTGILTTHEQFQGRAISAYDSVDNDYDATDCNGHGTHVSGTIGGYTYGVAKNVTLHAVRVLDCYGSGSDSGVIAGIEWVTRYHSKPAVVNMSLGGGTSMALDNAIKNSIRAGVTYVVAAGNESSDACYTSPARVNTAITVASSTKSDMRSSFSNYGSCVTLFAPGSDITSSWIGGNSAVNTISGTSMATPHATGVAALYLSMYPSATPAQVKSALRNAAVSGHIYDTGSGSPNLLLNTQFLGSAAQ